MKTLLKKTHQKGFTLIELLVVIGILAVLMGIVLVAVNPGRQFNQANNSKRSNDVRQLLNAIGQYAADNKGQLPAGIPTAPTAAATIANTGADLCAVLMPTYISALPQDPASNAGVGITTCTTYSTGYTVQQDANGRVTVTAPSAALGATISVTR